MSENIEHIQRFLDKLEDKMDKRLDKLEGKLDKLAEISSSNAIKLAENTTSLQEHMRRTDLLEEQLNQHKEDNENTYDVIAKNQEDLEKSVEFMVKFPKYIYIFGKWLTMFSTVAAFMYYVATLFFGLGK